MLAILTNAVFNQHKVQQMSDQFTLSKLKSLLHCMATSGPYVLQAQLTSEREKAAWRDLMVDLALQPIIAQDEGSSCTAKWGNVPVTLDAIKGDNNHVYITIGEETEILSDINLANLQKQIRSLVVEHSLWNPYDEHAGNVTDLKQYVALEELTDGLLDNSVIPAGRRAIFNSNCEDIYEALVPVFKKQPSGAIPITLSDQTQLTLTATDSSVTLAINGRGVTLAMSLKTFFEHLRVHIVSEGNYKHAGIPRQISSHYSDLDWHGRLYNKYDPSPAELAPDYKSQPYRTITERKPRTLNGKAYFTGTKQKIYCKHHGLQDTKDRLAKEDGKGKRDMSVNSTSESIAAHIPIEINVECKALLANAKRYDMVNNDEFGIHLAECFNDMSRKSETLRALSIWSCDHWMTVRLHIKGTTDKPVFVVSFFDPYFTNEVVRCETDKLSILTSHTLALYIDGLHGVEKGTYNYYYDGQDPVSIVLEVDSASLNSTSTRTGKKFSSFSSSLTPTLIYYLLAYNFYEYLAELQSQFEQIGQNAPDDLIALLEAKAKDMQGFYMALQDGHVEVIKVFGELLKFIPASKYDKLFDLLDAKNVKGVSGLFMALQRGNAETIRVYGELLKLIPEAERNKLFDLLVAKDTNGIPGLYIALQNGDAKTIRVYGELLKLIPEAERNKLFDLLVAKDGNGTPGLFIALENGSAETIRAYGELLKLIPETESYRLVELLAAKRADGATGLGNALQRGDAEVLKAYGELFKLIPKTESSKLVNLVAAKNAEGIPVLYFALQHGKTKAIKAYGELLKLIPKTERHKLVELLTAKRPEGIPGLYMLLQTESTEAVEAYLELLQLLPESEYDTFVAQIIAKDADSAPVLHKALAAGNRVVARIHNKLVNVISRWRANIAKAK